MNAPAPLGGERGAAERWWWAYRRPLHRDPLLGWVVVLAIVVAGRPFVGVPPAWVPGSTRELVVGLAIGFVLWFFVFSVVLGTARALGPAARSQRRPPP